MPLKELCVEGLLLLGDREPLRRAGLKEDKILDVYPRRWYWNRALPPSPSPPSLPPFFFLLAIMR